MGIFWIGLLVALLTTGAVATFIALYRDRKPGEYYAGVVRLSFKAGPPDEGYVKKGEVYQLLARDRDPSTGTDFECPPDSVLDLSEPPTCNVNPRSNGYTYGCAKFEQTRVGDKCYQPCLGAPVYETGEDNRLTCPTAETGKYASDFQEQVCGAGATQYVEKDGACQLRAQEGQCPSPLSLNAAGEPSCDVAPDSAGKTYGCAEPLHTRFEFRCYTPCPDGEVIATLDGVVQCLPAV